MLFRTVNGFLFVLLGLFVVVCVFFMCCGCFVLAWLFMGLGFAELIIVL